MVAREQPVRGKRSWPGLGKRPFLGFFFSFLECIRTTDTTCIYHDSGCSICSTAPLDHSDHCSPGCDWLYLDVCSVLSQVQYTDLLDFLTFRPSSPQMIAWKLPAPLRLCGLSTRWLPVPERSLPSMAVSSSCKPARIINLHLLMSAMDCPEGTRCQDQRS